MTTVYSYACKDYPGMEACPAHFQTNDLPELIRIIEHHANVAHGENPYEWSAENRSAVNGLIKTEAST